MVGCVAASGVTGSSCRFTGHLTLTLTYCLSPELFTLSVGSTRVQCDLHSSYPTLILTLMNAFSKAHCPYTSTMKMDILLDTHLSITITHRAAGTFNFLWRHRDNTYQWSYQGFRELTAGVSCHN